MMTLEQWCHEVDSHLDKIEAGAEMCSRHVKQLPLQPAFYSLAEFHLRHTEDVLKIALAKVQAARKAYQNKPIEK
jgi:hypothetical protein